jgi:hypothetical protein
LPPRTTAPLRAVVRDIVSDEAATLTADAGLLRVYYPAGG